MVLGGAELRAGLRDEGGKLVDDAEERLEVG